MGPTAECDNFVLVRASDCPGSEGSLEGQDSSLLAGVIRITSRCALCPILHKLRELQPTKCQAALRPTQWPTETRS